MCHAVVYIKVESTNHVGVRHLVQWSVVESIFA